MTNIIRADIYHDGEYYCGRCLDVDVFTQGRTLDEVVANLKEALQVHFDDQAPPFDHSASAPTLLTMMDMGKIYA